MEEVSFGEPTRLLGCAECPDIEVSEPMPVPRILLQPLPVPPLRVTSIGQSESGKKPQALM